MTSRQLKKAAIDPKRNKSLFASVATVANTKKIAKLTKKVKENEAPFTYGVIARNSVDLDTTPAVVNLVITSQPPSTSRDTKTLLRNISIKGIINAGTDATTTQYGRIVVVRDMRAFDNNVAPAWLDVFKNTDVFSMRADTLAGIKIKSFHILYDRTFGLENDNSSSMVHPDKRLFNMSKTFKVPIQQYNLDNYCKNLLYVMYVSTLATGASAMKMDYQFSTTLSTNE